MGDPYYNNYLQFELRLLDDVAGRTYIRWEDNDILLLDYGRKHTWSYYLNHDHVHGHCVRLHPARVRVKSC